MDMEIYFPGGKRVNADYGGFTIQTDQPARGGGDGSAPAPFDLFLASIGTCAGIYALGFMQQRGIDPQGSKLTMRTHYDPTVGLIDRVELELKTPAGFPDKYRDAIINAMELCAVKKHLQQPPAFAITTVDSDS
jgi:putative redox protein